MTFQNTDKILVNRGGVDYQAEIGPLMGGGSGGGGGGVTSIIAGSGISVDQTTGDVTITATGGGGGGGSTTSGAQKVAYLRDEKPNSRGGGIAVVGWQDRALNTKEDANNLVVLSNDKEFTLSAGEYQIEWSAPGKAVGLYQTKLTNVTDGTTQEMGSSEWSKDGNYSQTRSFGSTRIKITTDTTYKIEQYCTLASGLGLGLATSNMAPEVYTQVTITDLNVLAAGGGAGDQCLYTCDSYIPNLPTFN